jgi:hypothetical protein
VNGYIICERVLSFSQAANLSDFENTSLTHIDAVFSNLLNLLFS